MVCNPARSLSSALLPATQERRETKKKKEKKCKEREKHNEQKKVRPNPDDTH
jgi:hypothetical protein